MFASSQRRLVISKSKKQKTKTKKPTKSALLALPWNSEPWQARGIMNHQQQFYFFTFFIANRMEC